MDRLAGAGGEHLPVVEYLLALVRENVEDFPGVRAVVALFGKEDDRTDGYPGVPRGVRSEEPLDLPPEGIRIT